MRMHSASPLTKSMKIWITWWRLWNETAISALLGLESLSGSLGDRQVGMAGDLDVKRLDHSR